MKLGYFSNTNFVVSETFIYDLVKDLASTKELDLTYYSGKHSGKIDCDFNLKSVFTDYAEGGEGRSYRAFKMGQMFGKGYEYKFSVQRKHALRSLRNNIKELPEIAYVDYANSAVLVREFLELHNIPYIVHVHGYDITASLNDPVYAKELQKVFLSAKYFIAASHYMKRLLILLGAKEEKIKVIRYGIDVSSIKPMPWSERLKGNPSVVFLGRLTEKKHPIALLHAFKLVLKEVPEATLSIIGEGALKNEVIERINLLEMGHAVKLLGSLPREKSFPVMNKHWVFAQHSVTAKSGDQEGYALSPAEAASHEIPVVSTIHNGIPEHVLDGKTGYLVPEFHYEAMAEKIIYLLKNPAIAEEMGKAGRVNIERMNRQSERVAAILDLLRQ